MDEIISRISYHVSYTTTAAYTVLIVGQKNFPLFNNYSNENSNTYPILKTI